ncbi:hypothetical protein NUKP65_33680 [Klebsiella variicola]|nr:hypothetical protein KLVA_52550 [Klebsiella variicola]GKI98419.1 hypothetical protein NUKP18_56490 [Klebsiella variicola]GKJ82696.1 hypothetical protein NUKP33_49630 [Klebsiella variicola]GKM18008.1 hypothetical protein NUKP65_33680 [Klebsiella variicola]GKM45513.1 hypothetical protein NUKP66_50060 [Klebsiella variicola]
MTDAFATVQLLIGNTDHYIQVCRQAFAAGRADTSAHANRHARQFKGQLKTRINQVSQLIRLFHMMKDVLQHDEFIPPDPGNCRPFRDNSSQSIRNNVKHPIP